MSRNDEIVFNAYLASARRKPWTRCSRGTPARRLRLAILESEGAHCYLCHSHDRLRLAASTGAAWDSAVAEKGHAALLGRITGSRRLALYAAAAASPRIRPCCPRCIAVSRIRRQLEALNAAAHGPHHRSPL